MGFVFKYRASFPESPNRGPGNQQHQHTHAHHDPEGIKHRPYRGVGIQEIIEPFDFAVEVVRQNKTGHFGMPISK